MTPQLQSALDALNACPDADAVAQLLRRHGVRAKRNEGIYAECCALAIYFQQVGGAEAASVFDDGVADLDDSEGYEPDVELPTAAVDFVRAFDARAYPDLEGA